MRLEALEVGWNYSTMVWMGREISRDNTEGKVRKRVSDRVMSMKLEIEGMMMNFVCVYVEICGRGRNTR